MTRIPALLAFSAVFALCASCTSRGRIVRLEWPAMGTVAAVQVRGAQSMEDVAAIRDAARRTVAKVESLLNAHDPSSELSRLARLDDNGVIAACNPFVRPCYEAAFLFAKRTEGRFSPRWRGPGTLDLGAIAKGFAADLAADAVLRLQAAPRCDGILVDIGGNLKSAKGSWNVAILGAPADGVFQLEEKASAATSGEYFRGSHIIDAKTHEVAKNAQLSVSVVHPSSAMVADALSTICFILGKDVGARFIAENFPEALVYWTGLPRH